MWNEWYYGRGVDFGDAAVFEIVFGTYLVAAGIALAIYLLRPREPAS